MRRWQGRLLAVHGIAPHFHPCQAQNLATVKRLSHRSADHPSISADRPSLHSSALLSGKFSKVCDTFVAKQASETLFQRQILVFRPSCAYSMGSQCRNPRKTCLKRALKITQLSTECRRPSFRNSAARQPNGAPPANTNAVGKGRRRPSPPAPAQRETPASIQPTSFRRGPSEGIAAYRPR